MADTAPIVVRLGMSVDSTIEKSFASVEARANKAGKLLEQSSAKSATAAERAAQRKATAEEKAAARTEAASGRAAAKQQRDSDRRATAAQRSAQKEADAQIREINRAADARARAESRANRSLGQRFARSTADTATRFIAPYAPLASFARRTVGDLARGAGIQFDPGQILGRAIDLNARATTLSANAYQPGAEGAAGIRQDPGTIARESRSIAKKYGLDAGDVLGGLEKFTAVAGDLETGRKALDDMAKLALITGSNMENVVDAAGQVAAVLPEGADKAQRVSDVMKVLAGQGRLGAVELKDLATQMAKIAASAVRIEGDPVQNIERLGALAQLARQRGGRASGTQAATAVLRLADTLVTPKRAKAFAAAGIETIDKKSGLIRDPVAVIFDTIKKFGKDPIKFKELFANSIGAAPADALANVFRQGEDPRAAFDKFMSAGLGDKQIAEDLASALDTPKARIAKFQASLDELGDKMLVKLIPLFDQLAPKLLQLGDTLTNLVTWVAENPKEAIAAGIGLSIARAGIESTLRTGIERILTGAGGQNAGALGGAAGTVGGLFTIATLTVATLTVGKALIDFWATKDDKNQRDTGESVAHAEEFANAAEAKLKAGDIAGAKEAADKAKQATQTGLNAVGRPQDSNRTLDLIRTAAFSMGLGGIELLFDKKIKEAVGSRVAAEEASRAQLLGESSHIARILDQIAQNTSQQLPPPPPDQQPARGSQL